MANLRRQVYQIASFGLLCLWIQTLFAENKTGSSNNLLSTDRSRKDWDEDGNLPEFCSKLIARPVPYNKTCTRDWKTMRCRNNKEFQMFSQFQQDYFLYKYHFHKLGRQGVYLDVASNDAIVISNTYFFDRCLKWRGVCVEANSFYFERLYSKRSCQVVPTCVGSKNGEVVKFLPKGGAGGILGENYKSQKKVNTLESYAVEKVCTTIYDVLRREGIKTVDYLSLDVEGHELEVLKGIDFESVTINVMTVELNGGERSGISKFLKSKGFYQYFVPRHAGIDVVRGLLREDAVFIHNRTTFGYPR